MKSFIYKSLIIIASIILVFEFTIGNKISQVYEKIDVLSTKQGRAEGVNKIREEIKKAVNKERYLSKEDSKLLNKFISKIVTEISESN